MKMLAFFKINRSWRCDVFFVVTVSGFWDDQNQKSLGTLRDILQAVFSNLMVLKAILQDSLQDGACEKVSIWVVKQQQFETYSTKLAGNTIYLRNSRHRSSFNYKQ
jgi:hypothetical protein